MESSGTLCSGDLKYKDEWGSHYSQQAGETTGFEGTPDDILFNQVPLLTCVPGQSYQTKGVHLQIVLQWLSGFHFYPWTLWKIQDRKECINMHVIETWNVCSYSGNHFIFKIRLRKGRECDNCCSHHGIQKKGAVNQNPMLKREMKTAWWTSERIRILSAVIGRTWLST